LKLPSGAHPAADLLGPLRGDAFHVSFPVDRVKSGTKPDVLHRWHNDSWAFQRV
jgi:hypothetical protein